MKPLLPADLRDELHTAAYHIWGLIRRSERSEFNLEVFGQSIGRLQKARDKLEKYLDLVNPMAGSVK